MFKFKQYDFKRYNITLLIIVMILCIIGAFLIKQVQADDENLFSRQLYGIAGGLFIALFVSLFDYHFICNFYIVLYVINLVLLFLVKTSLGQTINDATRWVNIKGFQFQPSELSKIILILCLAMLFSLLRSKINNIFVLLLSAILVAIPTYMIFDQPNLSTSMVIMFIFVMMVFAAGLSWKIILSVVLIGVPLFIGLFWYVQQDYQMLLDPYQRNRVISFLHPEDNPAIMFQQENSVIAIGSGKLYGKLMDDDKSILSKDIPISESDFIYAAAGEEFGFIGSCIIIVLYAVIIYICLMTARKAPDYLGMLIAIGIASMFMFQIFVNIGVATKFLPNTGIPLPFLSYGLSSLISGMIAVGIIINIRLQPRKTNNNRGKVII